MEIIPAIIPKSLDDLREHMSRVLDSVPLVQIDACDGKFVPSVSWPYGREDAGEFARILQEEQGMPFWDKINFEADLMVANPEEEVLRWASAGAQRIIFHIESAKDPERIIQELHERNVEVVIALNIDTPEETIYPFMEKIDGVQCMGIRKIGFQGEEFAEEVLQKIQKIKKDFPAIIISVDGGVNFDSAPLLLDAGAERLVAGSAIFESGDIEGAIEDFKEMV